MSTLLATNLAGPSSTGTAATLASINGGPISGARNRIINGDMRIDQRQTAVTTSAAYTVDRWRTNLLTSGAVSFAQSSVAPPGFTNSLAISVTSADTSITASEVLGLTQAIEGLNVSDLGFGTASAATVTVSFWVRSTTIGTYCFSLTNVGGARSYVATYSINSANTWEYKTITIPGDTSGTWPTDNTGCMLVRFSFAAGSTYQTSAGSWQSGNFVSTAAQANLLASTSNVAYITGVQLEAGTVATPFERRSYGQEELFCKRYFESGMYGPFYLNNTAATAMYLPLPYKVTKRAYPTITLPASTNIGFANGGAGITPTTWAVYSAMPEVGIISIGNSSLGGVAQFAFTVSAEL